ncbi:serine protease [Prauserella halophila]|uniref:Serine protease n=1 Tax=Prauserella halophila TaxID=185641 RepID=A0ABP4GQX7_9PSEU|nr:serine protease [Prauserella halophila]MCP2235980.1 Trypsin [Prauserella halophila]
MRRLVTRAAGLAAALLLASAPAVSAAVQPDLVGGTPGDETYPFMTSLSADGEHYCGASLVRPGWLVTAAHCVDGTDAEQLTARIGSTDRAEGGEVAQPTKLVSHPSYTRPGSTGDLALVELDSPVEAEPVDLADSAEPGTATRLLGWGQTCPESGCGDAPRNLQQLDTGIVGDERCAAGFDATSEVCTDNPDGAGACYGDSGGPQLVRTGDRWRLVGVSSRAGNNEPVCGTAPSIYTSAPAYATWIDETVSA